MMKQKLSAKVKKIVEDIGSAGLPEDVLDKLDTAVAKKRRAIGRG
jgi:hypothetical protein